MKYLWTTICVKNMDESVAFYSGLAGLSVTQRFPAGPGKEIAFMGNGTENETLVELMSDKSFGAADCGESVSLGFAVGSVDAMLDTVKSKGIPVHSGPFETPRYKFFCIKDPSGLNVQFFQEK